VLDHPMVLVRQGVDLFEQIGLVFGAELGHIEHVLAVDQRFDLGFERRRIGVLAAGAWGQKAGDHAAADRGDGIGLGHAGDHHIPARAR